MLAALRWIALSLHGACLLAQDPLAILEQRCVACHNPARRKSDLDLTERAAALRGGSKGAALVPGDAGASLVMDLVEHRRTPHMPLREPALPPEEVAALRAWIDAGAEYPRTLAVPSDAAASASAGAHAAERTAELQVTAADRAFWSFGPLHEPPVPDLAQPARARTEIDRFWLAGLEGAGLDPAPEADRRTLLRRLCTTLLGLPPTPEQVEAFLADERPDAYERVVDELLASPHFGERQARHWLDVARYADSGGYEFDVERPHAYPYRDFVIEAMNGDMPFDEFVRLQVAADELRPDEPSAWRATGFLCAGPTVGNQENEQTRYDEYDDVVSTLGTAFLGLTVGCARCHDHKFDPIPTRDYYRLVATFTGTQREDRPLLPPRELDELRARERERDAARVELRERREQVERAARARVRKHRILALPVAARERALLLADSDPERLWLHTASTPPAYWFTEGFDGAGFVEAEAPFGVSERGFRAATAWTSSDLWARRTFTFDGPPQDLVFVAYHDEDLTVWLNGVQAVHATGYVQDWVLLEPSAQARAALRPGRNVLAVHCRQTAGGQGMDVVVARRSQLRDGDLRAAARSEKQRLEHAHARTLRVGRRELADAFTADERTELAAVRRAEAALPERRAHDAQKALVMTDRGADAPPGWLLRRGNPADKQERLAPGFLQVLTPEADQRAFLAATPPTSSSTGRRSALARWLVDVDHGAGRLLARVIVNRLWQAHMGRGIVGTPNDFGLQGERPTHPELLDWLAQRLIDGGFRLKPLHRLIVTSAVYRQACAHPADAQADDRERLWAGRERLRLDAETLRDAILQTSGRLNRALFGPSVKPWMHADAIATGSTNKWPLDVRDGPSTWRRSLYVFMRRSVRFPLLEVFDAPDATASCGRRTETTTPLQALALMNDPSVREQARLFAARVLAEAGAEPQRQVEHAMTLALLRPPSPDERVRLHAFLDAQRERHRGDARAALTDLCQVLFNVNEFLHVD